MFSHPRENGNSDLIKMKRIPFSKRDFNNLNKALIEDKKKPIKYKKFLDTKIQKLLEKYQIDQDRRVVVDASDRRTFRMEKVLMEC